MKPHVVFDLSGSMFDAMETAVAHAVANHPADTTWSGITGEKYFKGTLRNVEAKTMWLGGPGVEQAVVAAMAPGIELFVYTDGDLVEIKQMVDVSTGRDVNFLVLRSHDRQDLVGEFQGMNVQVLTLHRK